MASRCAGMALAFAGLLGAGATLAQTAAPSDVARLLVCVWRAVPGDMYTEAADGTRTYPFGRDAVTRFILTGDGYGANTRQYSDRPNCANGTGPRQCTAQDAEAAFQTASNYQYRYRLEPDAGNPYTGTMVWEVDLSVYPNWRGQTLTRRYE